MPKAKKEQRQESKTEIKSPAAKPQCHEVDFVLKCNGAEHVYVCGSFNDWQPTCLRLTGNPDAGLWEKRLVLSPGRHEYMFVVDGQCRHDRDARENVLNEFGTFNSVVEVRP